MTDETLYRHRRFIYGAVLMFFGVRRLRASRRAEHEVFGGFAIPLPRSLLEVKGGSRYVNGKQVEPACAITIENGHVCAEVVPSFEVNGLFDLLWIKFR